MNKLNLLRVVMSLRGATMAASNRLGAALAVHVPTRSSSASPSAGDDAPAFDMENPYKKEKQQCILCKYEIELNYKNPRLLSQFISSFTGSVYDKHITGLCDKQQKVLQHQIYLARRCGYMPIQHKNVSYMKDPPLFDPFKPTRPHPY